MTLAAMSFGLYFFKRQKQIMLTEMPPINVIHETSSLKHIVGTMFVRTEGSPGRAVQRLKLKYANANFSSNDQMRKKVILVSYL